MNYNVIKISILLLLVMGLYAFSNYRNNKRSVAQPRIQFLGDTKLFITEETVSKLLIQNQEAVAGQPKEMIDLNEIEKALNANPMIKKAEVYLSVNGALSAEIEQKRPIARISNDASYYLDDEGLVMPLSSNYAARVPLVTGNSDKNNLENVYQFAKTVDGDAFLKQQVIQIHQNEDNTIDFKIRKRNFTVHLGSLDLLEKKINNFKAFYQKGMKDKILNNYKHVNLKFDTQVICTKS